MTTPRFRHRARALPVALLLLLGARVFAQEAPAGDAPARAPEAASPAADPAPVGPIVDALSWRSLGPSVMGGRITDLALHPEKPYTFFLAAASGGVWKTDNNGTTWTSIFQDEGTNTIGDIAVDPNDPDVLWVGTGEANNQRSSYWGDGVYKSTDGGTSWTNTGLAETHHVACIVVDPTNSDRVFVAALGHLYTHNPERGLYRTTDGGATWEKVLFVNDGVGVVDVVIDPADPNTLYAASYERLRRAWHFDGAGPGSAIYKSTDGGDTWTKLDGGLPTGEIGRIGLDITPGPEGSPSIVYACVSNQNEAPAREREARAKDDRFRETFGFGASITAEGLRVTETIEGSPAAEAGLEAGDVIVAINARDVTNFWALLKALEAASGADSVHVAYVRNGARREIDFVLPEGRGDDDDDEEREEERGQIGGEIYRSVDGGRTWEKRNEKPVSGEPPYYYGQIRIDPSNPERLFLLGVPLFLSEDGGKTWRSDAADSVHVDHHALVIDPRNPRRVLLGNDGGLHLSYDGGATWDTVDNIPLGQFYAVGVDMSVPYRVYGGLQDNGTWGGPSVSRARGGATRLEWFMIGWGDGFYAQPDPQDPTTVYGEWQFGNLYRVDLSTGETNFIKPRPAEGEEYRFNWMSPVLLSPHNPKIVYFGGNKLFKSYDRGDTWHAISPDLTTADPAKIEGNVPHCTITTIAESPLKPNRLLVGTDDGKVQWSEDGGATWTDVSNRIPLVPRNWWVSRVEFSHHDADQAYVSFTGYREDDFRPFLFRTKDAGKTWEPIVGNLPSGPINVVREDRLNPDLLFAGTEFGVYASMDGGGTWHEIEKGLPTIAVHDLLVHPREGDLVIGTHGRGIYVANVSPLQELTAENRAKPAHLCRVADAYAWEFDSPQDLQGDRKFVAENPPYGARIDYHLREAAGEGALKLEVLDATGKVIRTLEASTTPGLHRVTWDFSTDPREEEGERRRRRRGGDRVGPGEYQVRLTLGETVQTRSVRVHSDPRPAPAPEPEEER